MLGQAGLRHAVLDGGSEDGSDGEPLLLICFVNETARERSSGRPVRSGAD